MTTLKKLPMHSPKMPNTQGESQTDHSMEKGMVVL